MYPLNSVDRGNNSLPDNINLHRNVSSPGKLVVGVGPVNDENLQHLRIQMAVNRYNSSNSASIHRQFSPAAYRCSMMRPKNFKLNSGDVTPNSDLTGNSSNFAAMLYSSPRQRFLDADEGTLIDGPLHDIDKTQTYSKQRWCRKSNQQKANIANNTVSTSTCISPEFRYTGPEQFPTCLINKGSNVQMKKKNILSHMKSTSPGLPVTRYMDDSSEKYSDLKSTRSVLDVLQDLSRKRIHGKDGPEEQSKRRCKGLGGDLVQEGEAPYKPLFVSKNRNSIHQRRDQTTQTSENNVEQAVVNQPAQRDSKWEIRKKLARQNNEILASLSSSIRGIFAHKRKIDSSKSKENNSSEKCEYEPGKKLKMMDSPSIERTPVQKKTENSSNRKDKPVVTDASSPKSPKNDDRLMTIFLDMKNSSEAKLNAIQSILESPGDKQFVRPVDKDTVDNGKISIVANPAAVPPVVSNDTNPAAVIAHEKLDLRSQPKSNELPSPPLLPVAFGTSVVATTSETTPSKSITKIAANISPVTTTNNLVSKPAVSVETTSSNNITPMFSFGLAKTPPQNSMPTNTSSPINLPPASTSLTAKAPETVLTTVGAFNFKGSEMSAPITAPFKFETPPTTATDSKASTSPIKPNFSLFPVSKETTPSSVTAATTTTSSPNISFNFPPISSTSVAPASTKEDAKPQFSFGKMNEPNSSSFGKVDKPENTPAPSFFFNAPKIEPPTTASQVSTYNAPKIGLSTTTAAQMSSPSMGLFTAPQLPQKTEAPSSAPTNTKIEAKPWNNTEVKWSFGGSITSVNSEKPAATEAAATTSKFTFGTIPTTAPATTSASAGNLFSAAVPIPAVTTSTETTKPSVFSRLSSSTKDGNAFIFGEAKSNNLEPKTALPSNSVKTDVVQPVATNLFSFSASKPADQNVSVFGKPSTALFSPVPNTTIPSFGTPKMPTSSEKTTIPSIFGTTSTPSTSSNVLGSVTTTNTSLPVLGAASTTSSTQGTLPATTGAFGQPENPLSLTCLMYARSEDIPKFRPGASNSAPVFNFGSATAATSSSAFSSNTMTFSFKGSGGNNAFQQPTATTASSTPAFGQTTPAFGVTTTEAAFGSGFGSTFGTKPAPAFGQTVAAPAFGQSIGNMFNQNAAPSFGMGGTFASNTSSTSTAPAATSTFSFDKSAAGNASTSAPFAFGGTSNTAPAFGTAPTTTVPSTPFATAGSSPFGSTAIAPSPPVFGSTPMATPSPFGSTAPAQPPPFGSSAAPAATPLPFGGPTTSASTAPAPFLFGATQTSKPNNSVFNFGASTPAQNPPSTFTFGATSNAPNFNFGANSASSSGGFSFSGTASTPSTGGFNQPTPSPSGFGGLASPFGQTPTPSPGGLQTPFGQTPSPGGFPVPGTFSIGAGSSQPRSRLTRNARRKY